MVRFAMAWCHLAMAGQFSPVAIPIDEHKTLLEAWSVLLRTVSAERPHTNSDTDEIRF